MREAAKALDDLRMIGDEFVEGARCGALGEIFDRQSLIGGVFGMFERDIKPNAIFLAMFEIKAFENALAGDFARLGVAGESARLTAINVARKLIQNNDQRQSGLAVGVPVCELALSGVLMEALKSADDFLVKGGVRFPPAFAAGIAPEGQNVLRGYAHFTA